MFRLEVKTTRDNFTKGSDKTQFGENYEWTMSKKHGEYHDPDLFYCFVIIRGREEMPLFFIVKSKDVADYIVEQQRYWEKLPRKLPRKNPNSSHRTFRIGINDKSHGLKPKEKYQNRWEILPKQ